MCSDEAKETPEPKKKLKDRITVVSQVYHQRIGRDPTLVESRFSRDLETQQQLYSRELEATEEWQVLDCGWLKSAVGMIVIQNVEGKHLQVNPTEAEQTFIAKKILCLSYRVVGPTSLHWWIPPGESFQGFPSNTEYLSIRSQCGVVEYTLTLFPR